MTKYRLGIRVNFDFEFDAANNEEAIEWMNGINGTETVAWDIQELISEGDWEIYDFEALWIADEDENVIAEI